MRRSTTLLSLAWVNWLAESVNYLIKWDWLLWDRVCCFWCGWQLAFSTCKSIVWCCAIQFSSAIWELSASPLEVLGCRSRRLSTIARWNLLIVGMSLACTTVSRCLGWQRRWYAIPGDGMGDETVLTFANDFKEWARISCSTLGASRCAVTSWIQGSNEGGHKWLVASIGSSLKDSSFCAVAACFSRDIRIDIGSRDGSQIGDEFNKRCWLKASQNSFGGLSVIRTCPSCTILTLLNLNSQATSLVYCLPPKDMVRTSRKIPLLTSLHLYLFIKPMC